jgi:hypothetical protein
MRKLSFFAGLLALALAACGQADTGAPPATSAPTIIAEQPTAAPTAAPTSAPAATVQPAATSAPAPTQPAEPSPGSGLSVEAPPELVTAAQQQLAKYLKVSPDALKLQSANAKEWPDGSLGCPEEGMVYPQVLVPGYLLIFTDSAQSVQYEVHTGQSEAQLVLCQNKKRVDLSTQAAARTEPSTGQAAPPSEAGKGMGQLAQEALARELGQNAADVTVVAVEETTWSDSSLGCPKPGMNYLQVITPGYKITLESQGKRYEYHTDTNQRVVRCDRP